MIWFIHSWIDCCCWCCCWHTHNMMYPMFDWAGHECALSNDRDCSIWRGTHTHYSLLSIMHLNYTGLTEPRLPLRNKSQWEKSVCHVRWDRQGTIFVKQVHISVLTWELTTRSGIHCARDKTRENDYCAPFHFVTTLSFTLVCFLPSLKASFSARLWHI